MTQIANPVTVPQFKPLTSSEVTGYVSERKVLIPKNRINPLRNQFIDLIRPLVEQMKLQVKYDDKRKAVHIRPSESAEHSSLQKGVDYINAFVLGFEIRDAVALLQLDDLYIDSFEIQDVKPLHGDHESRAIGRIAGKDGSMKFSMENSTKTRIVMQESKIHILGSYQNIALAKDAICSLILGSPPSKVYGNLRNVSKRVAENF